MVERGHGRGGGAHRRVRVAMYATLLLLAVLTTVRAVRLGQSEQVRQLDMEIIRVAAEQSSMTQRMGLQAARLALHPLDPAVASALSDTLSLSQLHAQHLEDLFTRQVLPESLAGVAQWQAQLRWQRSRSSLWTDVKAVLLHASLQDAKALTQALDELQTELDQSLLSSGDLVVQVQNAAYERSRVSVVTMQWLTGGALVLFALLGLLLVEPTARAVRRQYRALASQTDRLKRLAMVAELSSNAMAVTDENHRVMWVNEAFSELTAYPPARAQGRRLGTLLKARSADPAGFAEFSKALRGGAGHQARDAHQHQGRRCRLGVGRHAADQR